MNDGMINTRFFFGFAALLFVPMAMIVCLASCTDADMAQIDAYGNPAEITCYSGGKIFYHGFSTGKVHSEEHSDGWYFQEKDSNLLIRVSGPCVVSNSTRQ